MHGLVRHAAVVAATAFAVALAAFGTRFDAYSQIAHPPALLGASEVPRAGAFNLFAFLLPGLLATLPALALRARLGAAGWATRVGAQALLLSALAFGAQGLLPLDSLDLDATASRLHAAAWTAWWIAFGVAAALLAWGAGWGRGGPVGGRRIAACALASLAFALLAPAVMPVGIAQRLAFGCWFLGLWFAGRPQP